MLEVEDNNGARALVWPHKVGVALPPTLEGVASPRLARLGPGVVRVEEVPAGALLSDLLHDLIAEDRGLVLTDVRGILVALHGVGAAHGEVVPHRVWISGSGAVWVVGAGVEAGDRLGDLAALSRLAEEWGLAADAPVSADRAGLAAAAAAALVGVPPEARRIALQRWSVSSGADMDEVRFDLGPDEARGLLDGWSRSAPTGERTGALSEDADRAHARLATLAAAIAALDAAPAARHVSAEGQVPEGFVDAIRAEPLDPLPTPDGLPPPALVALAPGDPLSEVTAIATHPLFSDDPATEAGDRSTAGGILGEFTRPRITSPDPDERTATAEVTARDVASPGPALGGRVRALMIIGVTLGLLSFIGVMWALGS